MIRLPPISTRLDTRFPDTPLFLSELLLLSAAVTIAIPLAHGLATGMWPWTSAVAGHWAPFWVDAVALAVAFVFARLARASTRRAREGEPNSVWANPRSEEHTSELQSLMRISYAVFCLKKKNTSKQQG